MATRSRIGVRNTDGTIDSIYCHWDGYPENNGKILTTHYQDMDKVNELIKLGNLSSLDMTTDLCVAYHRDRQEKYRSPNTTTFEDLFDEESDIEYTYVFDGEFWECYRNYTKESVNLY